MRFFALLRMTKAGKREVVGQALQGFRNSLKIPLNPPLQKGDFMERGFPKGGLQRIILKRVH